jgi:hypothetical protein
LPLLLLLQDSEELHFDAIDQLLCRRRRSLPSSADLARPAG